jgi:ATP-binding cassette subfamily F protein 3
MIALSFSQLKKYFDDQKVLDNISFSINVGDKLGLIGKNGAGKTTLLRLIASEQAPDSGVIYKDSKLRVGYMTQTDAEQSHHTLVSFCMEAFKDLLALEDRISLMEEQMHQFNAENDAFFEFMQRYEKLTHHFDHLGGYVFRSKVRGILTGLGFSEEAHTRPISELSGGQLARLKLARLLIDEPEILILDEPTNHLDIQTTIWLESYLKQYPHTLILVSHDRYFMDRICNVIMELEGGRAMLYEGNYSAFKKKKAAQLEQMKKQYEKAMTERAKQEAIIRKFKQHGTEKLAKRAKSREKRLAHQDIPDFIAERTDSMKLKLTTSVASGNEVLHVEDLHKSYGPLTVLNGISFNLFKGEKVGLIGANGTGKTTLFKLLDGSLEFDQGLIQFGHHVMSAYYDQTLDDLNEENTIIDEIHDFVPQMNQEEIRSLLGRFLFSNDEVFKPISVLSGGERARVMLTKLFLTQANFLLLDEPTNHLDLYSKEVLEDALLDFDGTLLVISHDRYFLDRICNQIIEIEDGNAVLYHGDYSYYIEKKAALKAPVVNPIDDQTKTERKLDKRKERETTNKRRDTQKQLLEIERTISEYESRIEVLAHELCDEAVYSNPQKTKAIITEQKKLKIALDEAYDEWATLTDSAQVLT